MSGGLDGGEVIGSPGEVGVAVGTGLGLAGAAAGCAYGCGELVDVAENLDGRVRCNGCKRRDERLAPSDSSNALHIHSYIRLG